jgi:mannose-6-phosphate isomerase-like protein (cupin superfamily)
MSRHDTLTCRVLLDSERSRGAAGIVEVAVPAAWDGPPLHHHDFDETFYVLDGELTIQVGDDIVTVGAGEAAFAPRGSHHTLANLGDAPARYLLTCTPGGFERMFARLEARAAGVEPSPEAQRPYPETTMVGPTLFERLG